MINPLKFSFKSEYYTKNILINGFITAALFSSFIYFEYFDLSNKLVNTISVLLSYYLFLTLDKKSMFFAGFFISLLWFWWIAISFIYYELIYLIPLVLLFISSIFGMLFYFSAYFSNKIVRIFLLVLLHFSDPLGFNWLKLDLPLINTYFNTYESKVPLSDLKIYMPKYNVDQFDKWNKNNIVNIINENLKNIRYAIHNNYDLVVLPETAFPINLQDSTYVLNELKQLSKKIIIITGAISSKNNLYYNSTYKFDNTNIQIANKVVLVPFGESIPAPKIIKDFINKYFFNGASDYLEAINPSTFTIKGQKFRNAICYEATSAKIYENIDVNYIIATSNNAWFTPSIEPTLQKLLLRYYAKKNKVIIYHSANKSKNMIIK